MLSIAAACTDMVDTAAPFARHIRKLDVPKE